MEDTYLIDESICDITQDSEKSKVVHIHDRMIDKDTAMNIYKISADVEDKIYTQSFTPENNKPHYACIMLMDLGAIRNATFLLINYREITHKKIGGAKKNTGDITVKTLNIFHGTHQQIKSFL